MLDDKITLDVLIDYLGQPTKKIGVEYVWQCPFCRDTHKDNLKFNETKGFLKCFANDSHSTDILREVNKRLNDKHQTPQTKPIKSQTNPLQKELKPKERLTKEELTNNFFYMLKSIEELQATPNAQKQLLDKRGIKKEIAGSLGIGIDLEKHCFVFPIFSYSTNENINIIGFEYRPSILPNAIKEKRTPQEQEAKKKISRKKGSISGLAMINAKTHWNNNLAIVEGFLDGYALYQHLTEIGQIENYHIVTPSNGIGVLKNQLKEIDFNNYIDVYLYVDNDEKSKLIVAEILKEYPEIIQISLDCCKDFNEHYLKCIKAREKEETGMPEAV